MRKAILIILLMLVSVGGVLAGEIKNEVTAEQAIKIAVKAAENNGFNTSKKDVEILKFKKGLERGPMRIVFLFRAFPKPVVAKILNKEFWVIYLYPKNQLEDPHSLGGDFTAIVDLHNGNVIEAWKGM